jgi:hypothetical protein
LSTAASAVDHCFPDGNPLTDRYPPFQLDQGSSDIEGPPQSPADDAWQVEHPPGYWPEAERG